MNRLLDNYNKINEIDNNYTLLHALIDYNQVLTIKYPKDLEINYSELFLGGYEIYNDIIINSIKKVIVDHPEYCQICTVDGAYPLHLAVSQIIPNYEIIQLLIHSYPEAIKLKDNNGLLPIQLLVLYTDQYIYSFKPIIQLLLRFYPNSLSIVDKSLKQSTLQMILYKNKFHCIKYIDKYINNNQKSFIRTNKSYKKHDLIVINQLTSNYFDNDSNRYGKCSKILRLIEEYPNKAWITSIDINKSLNILDRLKLSYSDQLYIRLGKYNFISSNYYYQYNGYECSDIINVDNQLDIVFSINIWNEKQLLYFVSKLCINSDIVLVYNKSINILTVKYFNSSISSLQFIPDSNLTSYYSNGSIGSDQIPYHLDIELCSNYDKNFLLHDVYNIDDQNSYNIVYNQYCQIINKLNQIPYYISYNYQIIDNVDYPNPKGNLFEFQVKSIDEAKLYASRYCYENVIVVYDKYNTIWIKDITKSGSSIIDDNRITFLSTNEEIIESKQLSLIDRNILQSYKWTCRSPALLVAYRYKNGVYRDVLKYTALYL